MGTRTYKKKLDSALWELVLIAQDLGVTVEVLDPRMNDNHDMLGCFFSTDNKIQIWKEADEPISAMHVAVLAHELAHVMQFRNGRYPNYWLMTIGFLPNWKDAKISETIENEADDYAKEFLVKHKIKVPEVFDRKRIERKEKANEATA